MCQSPEDERLIVKNLEDIQGDERDIIFISVCYGFDEEGSFLRNFGPINKPGGDRRLNVLFSRARYEMILFANFEPHQLTTANNRGLMMLQKMMQQAVAVVDVGSTDESAGVLNDICDIVRGWGYLAHTHYGRLTTPWTLLLPIPSTS